MVFKGHDPWKIQFRGESDLDDARHETLRNVIFAFTWMKGY
jgi:hypothetical protein